MSAAKRQCRHGDIRIYDGFRCCLACGEAIFDPVGDTDDDHTHEKSKSHKFKRLNHELGQEIRLLMLQPGQTSDPLTCEIVHVNLNDNPIYEALSYTWADEYGDTTFSREISCASSKTTIQITNNCESALRALRQKGRRRPLWVDAICINQDDLSERNHQIGFMGKIYSEASQVLIYLGPETFFTKVVLEWLESPTSRSNLELDAVRQFLRARYFDRVWVLQEIALAKLITLVAGNKQVRWTAEAVRSLQEPFPNESLAIPSALQWHPGTELEHDFLKVLHKSRHCSATDPRDKVYALLGLASEEAIEGLPIDYSFDEPQVYSNVARWLITKKRRLDILKHMAGEARISWRRNSRSSAPSWVPRWGPKRFHTPLPEQFASKERRMFAEQWFLPFAHNENCDLVQLEDLYISKVGSHCDSATVVTSTADWYAWLSNPLHPAYNTVQSGKDVDPFILALYISYKRNFDFQYTIYESPVQPSQASHCGHRLLSTVPQYVLRVRAHFLATMTSGWAGDVNDGEPVPTRCAECKTGNCTHKNYEPSTMIDESSIVRTHIPDTTHYERAKIGQPHKDEFETTKSIGFLAVEDNVINGDTIWALPDVDVPFVLRQVESHYELIGQCYLNDALDNLKCTCCGVDMGTNGIVTQIIDIW